MKIKLFFILIAISVISLSCKTNELVKTHGVSYLENREKLLIINKSNKNDTVQIFGQPSTKGMTDDNVWIYIERSTTRGNLIKMGKSYIKKNNTLVLEFDKYGILKEKKFYDKNNMKKINFAKNVTENEIRKENFIYSFLSSVRQKMQTKRK